MKKELDMFEPLICGFNIYGSLFSILHMTDDEKKWICNNFIQLRYLNDANVIFFENYRDTLYNCPNVTVNRISRNILKYKWQDDILKLVKEMIDNSYYILLYVDRYYIKQMNFDHNSMHELFIYGYDDETEELLCADNLETGKYKRFKCPFDQFVQAYWNLDNSSYYTDLHCITAEFGSDMLDKINLSQIIKLLKDYISSEVTVTFGERFSIGSYGIKTHIEALNRIRKLESNKKIDLRPIYTIFEHKKLMVFRLEYLKKSFETDVLDDFINCYTELHERYEVILRLIQKYNITFVPDILSRIIKQIDEAIDLEKTKLNALLNAIEGLNVIKIHQA